AVILRGDDTLTIEVGVAGSAALGQASLTIRTDLGTVTVPITIVTNPNPSTITTVAGSGQQIRAFLNQPFGVAVDSQGNLFIADTENDRVRKVSTDGTITTVAGSGVRGFAGDGDPATSAQLALPTGVAVDAQGNVFIADRDNARIRKVSPDGTINSVDVDLIS